MTATAGAVRAGVSEGNQLRLLWGGGRLHVTGALQNPLQSASAQLLPNFLAASPVIPTAPSLKTSRALHLTMALPPPPARPGTAMQA